MPLQPQVIGVQLGGGVDTKTDSRQLVPGKMVVLENANLETTKKYKKRPGSDSLTTQDTDGFTVGTNPIGLASFQDQLLQYNGVNPFSYSPEINKWQDVGSFTPLAFSKKSLNRTVTAISNQDVAIDSTSGIQCYVYNGNADTGPAKYQIIDGTTGTPLSGSNGGINSVPSLSSNSIRVKVFVMGANFVFVGMDSSTKQLFYSYVPINIPLQSASSAVAISTVADSSNFVWDGSVLNGTLFFSYQTTSNVVATSFLTQNFVHGVTVSSTASGSKCICTFTDGGTLIWVACSAGTTAKYFIYNSDLTPFLATTNFGGTWTAADSVIRNITGIYIGGGQARFFYESAPTNYDYDGFVISGVGTSGGAINSDTNTTYGVGLISKPFLYRGTDTYVLACRQSTLQTTYFLINQANTVICKSSAGVAGGLNGNGSHSRRTTGTLSNVITMTSTSFLIAGIEVSQTTSTPLSAVTYGVVANTYEFDAAATTVEVTAQNVMLVTGGTLMMYDGAYFCEHGFLYYPEDLVVTQSTGGDYADGVYNFQVVFEWTDAQGNVYQSTPSSEVQVTITSGSGMASVIVTCSGLTLTQKIGARIAVYRTAKDETTAPLQRDSTFAVSTADTRATATLISTTEPPVGNNIYTTGGAVGNDSPPATKAIALYRNRAVVVPCEQASSFWYSKSIVPGASTDFSLSFTWNIDTQGGDIVGAIQMDEKLILGKGNNFFFMSGSGPADTGANNDFTDAQILPTDCGVVDLKSLVLMPQGILFKSGKGIYQLDRSLQISYIGADVEQYNDGNVTAAFLLRDGRTARFSLDSGILLSYNYFLNQWSTIPNASAVDAAIFENVYCYLKSDGTVVQEDLDSFSDSGNPIKLKLQTGWISFNQLQGYQRVYKLMILGDYISSDQMVVSIAYDFNPDPKQIQTVNLTTAYGPDSTWGSSATWGSDAFWGGTQFPPMQAQIDTIQQKCQSIQITIEDSQSYNSGEGFEISGLAFEVGVEPGLFRINEGRSFG